MASVHLYRVTIIIANSELVPLLDAKWEQATVLESHEKNKFIVVLKRKKNWSKHVGYWISC